jgi:hypothetical protein
VEGQRWQRRLDTGAGKRSLVRVDNDVATVVTGTFGYSELSEFASSLR